MRVLRILAACFIFLGTVLKAQTPGTVTNLAVVATTATTATLQWTEVPSGGTTPAAYDIRFGPTTTYAWWLIHLTPPDTVRGSSVAGGVMKSFIVVGLTPATAYTFQLTAFTGTLNVNAVFSLSVSNPAQATTASVPVNPPPPPPLPATVASVTINTPAVAVQVGRTVTLTAIVKDSVGNLLTRPVTWRSRTPTVATVDSTGLVRTVLVGVDTVTATAGAITATGVVTVTPVPSVLTSISMGVMSMGIRVNEHVPVLATAFDQNGNILATPFVWSVSDTTVATVTQAGVVAGVRIGRDTIFAAAGGKRGVLPITVDSATVIPPLPPVIAASGISLDLFKIPIVAGTFSGTFTDSTGVRAHWTLTVTIP